MSEPVVPGVIEVAGLESGYHGVTVLKGLDFEVRNEVFAILGANGAGKTTLLATLARLLPLTGGTIRYAGEDVSHLRPYEAAAKGLAYVPQEQGVFPSLTVLENLRVGGLMAAREHDELISEVFELFPALRDMQQQMAVLFSLPFLCLGNFADQSFELFVQLPERTRPPR